MNTTSFHGWYYAVQDSTTGLPPLGQWGFHGYHDSDDEGPNPAHPAPTVERPTRMEIEAKQPETNLTVEDAVTHMHEITHVPEPTEDQILKIEAETTAQAEAATPPHEYICAISKNLMDDPVVAADGYTYERKDIEEWIHRSKNRPNSKGWKSPKGGILVCVDHQLIPNRDLKSLIFDWKQKHPQYDIVQKIPGAEYYTAQDKTLNRKKTQTSGALPSANVGEEEVTSHDITDGTSEMSGKSISQKAMDSELLETALTMGYSKENIQQALAATVKTRKQAAIDILLTQLKECPAVSSTS